MTKYLIRNVLAAIDFSPISLNALASAVSICKKHNASMTVVYVIENTNFLYSPAGGLSAIALLPELLKTATERLNEISTTIRNKHNLNIGKAVLTGNAAEGICQKAHRDSCDLVVIGSHGTGKLKSLIVGTTAYSIVKNSPAPVLTIPFNNQWLDFRRILFPVRVDSHSLSKYERILPIVRKEEASVLMAGIIEKNNHAARLQVESTVSEIQNRLVNDDIPCDARLYECKNIARQVLDIAEEEKTDMIVISTTTRTQVWDIFTTPFSQQVVDHSRFPVLSIRPEVEVEEQLRLSRVSEEWHWDRLPVPG